MCLGRGTASSPYRGHIMARSTLGRGWGPRLAAPRALSRGAAERHASSAPGGASWGVRCAARARPARGAGLCAKAPCRMFFPRCAAACRAVHESSLGGFGVHSAGARPPGPCVAQCLAAPVLSCARVGPGWRPAAPAAPAAFACMQRASPACMASDVAWAGCTALCVQVAWGARSTPQEGGARRTRLRRRLNVRDAQGAAAAAQGAAGARATAAKRAAPAAAQGAAGARRKRSKPSVAPAAAGTAATMGVRHAECAPRSGGREDVCYKERRPTPGLGCARGVLQGRPDGRGELTACLDLALHEQVHWQRGRVRAAAPPECELR